MDISRPWKIDPAPASATAAAPRTGEAAPAATPNAADAAPQSRPLEQLRAALRELPEIDLDKVAALRKALREGQLDVANASLAAGILAHHGRADE